MKNTNNMLRLAAVIAGLALQPWSGANAADPVITDPKATTIGIVTGGDVGEGLDLEGTFLYAISVGAAPDLDVKIRDATFKGQQVGDEVPGATLEAGNRILNWYNVNYGDSANDDSLEAATSSIRWSQAGNAIPAVTLTLENLEIGANYKVQMLFGEQCCNRGFDVFFDDHLVVKDFNPGVVQGGVAQGSQEALITHLYTPKTKTIVLRFDGTDASSDYSDHNAILNAVTVEKLGAAVDTDKDGMPDLYEIDHGFNPNDPSDAAKDFDKDGVSNLDEYKAGTNPTNITPPSLVSAAGSPNFTTVTLNFDDLEVLDQATAENPANYSFSPALKVVSATLKKKTVTLTTAAQTPGATKYTVTVTGVKDLSKNTIGANNKASFYSYLQTKTGVLKFSYWGGINGTPVQGLYDDPRYPATPDLVLAVNSFNSRDAFPDDSHENYGATLEGFLTPTESASYRFFIYSDDASQLFLSTDDKEANLSQIAEETGCCHNFTEPDSPRTSEPVALVANKKYFVRLVYKEGGGGDYGQVAWRKEGDKTAAGSLKPIPGQFLSAAVDLPAAPEGAFTVRTPADKAKNVSPATGITIGHRDGKTAWTSANTSLKVDGKAVTPTFTKVGTVLTLDYKFPGLLASASAHTVTLSYLDAGGNPAVSETTFTAAAYAGPTLDKVGGYPGLLLGSAVYTADAGGHTAKAGDYGVNLTLKGGPVATYDAAFLAAANAATAQDELTVAFWQKKLDVADSSAFTLNSPSAGNHRGFHAHVPWSNQNVYFDTTGCCDGATQRISADIATFSDYTPADATFWTGSWHFFVFTKKGPDKNIWIDGKLFLNGQSTNPLLTDHNAFFMGSGADAGEVSHAIIDDFSVFGKALVEADIVALSKGTLPTAMASSKGLIAYWDYNDALKVVAISNLKASAAAGGKFTITFDGAGIIQSSDTVNGTYADTAIKSGDQITVAGGAKFYRAKK